MAGVKGVIPKSWVTCPLSEIVTVNPGTFSKPPDDKELVSFVPMAAVGAETGRLDPRQTRTWKSVRSGYSRFQDGDVLFAKITPCMENGKFAVVSGLFGGRGAGSTEFHVLRPADGVNPKLLLYFLLRKDLRRDARARMKGAAGQLRVPPVFFAETEFSLAPSAEQDRIVAATEEQLTRLDAGAAALERVQAKLKRYRASVLKAACEGRLVPTEAELARAEGRSYESGEELRERTLRERRAEWEAGHLAKVAVKAAEDDEWKTRYQEPVDPDPTRLSKLPEGWTWATVDQLATVVRGASPRPAGDPKLFGGEIPWITVGAITADASPYLRAVSEGVTEAGKAASRYIPAETLLLTNSGATLGVPKITLIAGCINDGSVALLSVPDPTKLYLYYFLSSQTRKLRAINQGAAQPNLNTTIVRSILVPLPPPLEQ